jgi:hypothetical protein
LPSSWLVAPKAAGLALGIVALTLTIKDAGKEARTAG